MAEKRKFDFSGFATKVGLVCSDGRTIIKDAFKHHDGQKVPLVWQHIYSEPQTILGHAILENRNDGVYCYGSFNNTDAGKNAKELVAHGDITALSIFATSIKQQGKSVIHGMIKEVSLVLAGANPGAYIDHPEFAHSDGNYEADESEATIYTGLPLEHSLSIDSTEDDDSINNLTASMNNEQKKEIYSMIQQSLKHAESKDDNRTVQEVFDSLDDTQKNVVYAMIAAALESNETVEHSEQEGDNIMKTNVFDKTAEDHLGTTLSHDQISAIMADAKKCGSFKEAILAHAAEYGIENIDILFPDAQNIRPTPDMIKRDDDWVASFLSGVFKTPFSRIRSKSADLTADEARAKGYITGKKKIEEVFPVMKRTTTPTTIYKKQKLDRDDIVDITDFDVVAWLKVEMRAMLNEEIARAALIGDGRSISAEDKINPMNVRPVWQDDELYTHHLTLEANTSTLDLIDQIVKARKFYKGSGNPNFYSTEDVITDMMLVRDLNQRRIYPTMSELASALRVKEIIAVEVMEDQVRAIPNSTEKAELVGILLNPRDYTIGADKGGQVAMFDDFDIDYNQHKYLIETRISGALTKPKSAVAIEKFTDKAAG